MRNPSFLVLNLIAIVIIAFACGKSGTETPPANEEEYDELIAQGWQAFAEKNYSNALEKFEEAESVDASSSEAYSGIGWAYLMLDSLTKAEENFATGSQKTLPGANLNAGWAFALHLLHNYDASIENGLIVLQKDPEWKFENGTSLNKNSVVLLLATNYFLTGNFSQSLVYIQKLNPIFTVDVFTAAGRASLSQELERLSNSGE
ncbi:MAG: hypothetical protein H6696_19575 [Deferribacteres bacterium]|nr:hypothetical protein [candidate division KSB1 bacterium]MCB9504129.1 hypothetical protein [Deferribacteres bacterium]